MLDDEQELEPLENDESQPDNQDGAEGRKHKDRSHGVADPASGAETDSTIDDDVDDEDTDADDDADDADDGDAAADADADADEVRTIELVVESGRGRCVREPDAGC